MAYYIHIMKVLQFVGQPFNIKIIRHNPHKRMNNLTKVQINILINKTDMKRNLIMMQKLFSSYRLSIMGKFN